MLGPASILCFLTSAVLCTLLALCFAEVGSRFAGTGGPMLYSQAAFGDTAGFLVGWITWIVRVASWAALANGLVLAIDALIPGAAQWRIPLLILIFVGLSYANMRGVALGAQFTNFFTVAKLLPLLVFIVVGVFYLEPARFTPFAPLGYSSFADGTLLILYAFVGFEVLVIPAAEMRDPKRSIPIALGAVILVSTVVYIVVWAVCTGTLDGLAASENPVAQSSTQFLGTAGGKLIAIGIFLSVFGINTGSALVSPRSLYALAKAGYLPKILGSVHSARNTPVAAIAVTCVLSLGLAISGTFEQLAVVSVIARFAQYISTCAALPVLRRKQGIEPAGFMVPGGTWVAFSSIALCIWLLAVSDPVKILWGLIAMGSGLFIYWPYRYFCKPADPVQSET